MVFLPLFFFPRKIKKKYPWPGERDRNGKEENCFLLWIREQVSKEILNFAGFLR